MTNMSTVDYYDQIMNLANTQLPMVNSLSSEVTIESVQEQIQKRIIDSLTMHELSELITFSNRKNNPELTSYLEDIKEKALEIQNVQSNIGYKEGKDFGKKKSVNQANTSYSEFKKSFTARSVNEFSDLILNIAGLSKNKMSKPKKTIRETILLLKEKESLEFIWHYINGVIDSIQLKLDNKKENLNKSWEYRHTELIKILTKYRKKIGKEISEGLEQNN